MTAEGVKNAHAVIRPSFLSIRCFGLTRCFGLIRGMKTACDLNHKNGPLTFHDPENCSVNGRRSLYCVKCRSQILSSGCATLSRGRGLSRLICSLIVLRWAVSLSNCHTILYRGIHHELFRSCCNPTPVSCTSGYPRCTADSNGNIPMDYCSS